MNRGQLRADLKLRLRIATVGDPLLDDPTLNECIRLALLDVSSVSDWPWLLTSAPLTFSTVTGTAPYPTGCVKLRELVMGGNRACRVGLSEWLDSSTSSSGYRGYRSYVWTETGGTISLTPIPSTVPTAVLWFVRSEPVMAADGDTPLLPEAHQAVLLARASYHANTRRRRQDEAMFDQAEYESGVKRMTDAMWAKTGPRQIRSAGRSDSWAVW